MTQDATTIKYFSIWTEGYAATGESGGPTFMGTGRGRTFDEAVEDLKAREPSHYWSGTGAESRYWGCRVFESQAEAAVSFG